MGLSPLVGPVFSLKTRLIEGSVAVNCLFALLTESSVKADSLESSEFLRLLLLDLALKLTLGPNFYVFSDSLAVY